MKLGIEVEGRFKGIPTLFLSAMEFLKAEWCGHKQQHVYVSDHDNTLPYELFSKYPTRVFTLELTQVKPEPRPGNVFLMLLLPGYESVSKLNPGDQFKFHDEQRNVLCATQQSLIATSSEEFENDVEL